MSIPNRSQGSIFSIAGKALSSPNSILKAKSPLTQNKQQTDYKLDVDIKGDTVKDKLLSWKYAEYKKRFMAELGNQTPDEKNNILLKSLQDTNGNVGYVKWFKNLMTPFKNAYHKKIIFIH